MAQVKDAGLGLSEFLNGSDAPEGETPSQDEAPEIETKPQVEDEPAVEEKAEEKADEKEVKADSEEPKEPQIEEKVESKPHDWDSDDNPYKKQYFDTQRYATQVNQDNVNLKRQFEIINKKLDGTYDPETDVELQAPADQISAMAEVRGKALASREYAVEMAQRDGKDAAWVEARIAEFDRTYGRNPAIQARVLTSQSPVVEALKVLDEQSWLSTWGRDVKQIEAKIRDDERKKFEAKVEETVNKRLEERLKNIGKQPTGIREAHQVTEHSPNNGPQLESLEDILAG